MALAGIIAKHDETFGERKFAPTLCQSRFTHLMFDLIDACAHVSIRGAIRDCETRSCVDRIQKPAARPVARKPISN
jgi:hypothetical protein